MNGFVTGGPPAFHSQRSVTRLMLTVELALLPGILTLVWFFGPGVLINAAIAGACALGFEAAMLALRRRPILPTLSDHSALLSALLLAIALPPHVPWWVTVTATFFAIVVAKQLYGGLGCNPFNPAMVGYVVALIAFPQAMTHWVTAATDAAPAPDWHHALAQILRTGATPDAFSGATPLDFIRTELSRGVTLADAQHAYAHPGLIAAAGWEWVNLAFLLGGGILLARRHIDWRIPLGVLIGIGAPAWIGHLSAPQSMASPLLHGLSGATMLGAFFIATDPVSASTTPTGRWLFGLGVGALTWLIRSFGGYPDAMAFAILLMNLTVPLLDHYTRPRIVGEHIPPDNPDAAP